MKVSRSLIFSTTLFLIALLVAVHLYPNLPPRVPIHWDAQGQVNGWASPFWAVAIWPLLIAVLAILTWVLPVISPRKFEIKPFTRTYYILMLGTQAFLLVVGVCAMLAGAGYPIPIPLVATLAVGALFMLLGNYMGKLRKNFFAGIRTPWTLASTAVWERTHRLAGWLFMLAGLVWIVVSLTPASHDVWPLLVVAFAAAGIPCVYSYFVYRRLATLRQLPGEDE